MNWFGRLLMKAAGFPTSRSLSLTDPSGWDAYSNYSGKHVDDDSAMRVSTVWACNRVISETVASLPGGIFERDDSGNMRRIDHDLATVLVDAPNAEQTAPEFYESMMLNQGLRGNAYALIDRGPRARIESLTPIEACHVNVKRKDNGAVVYEVNDRGKVEKYPQEKIWHWKTFGRDRLLGLSPIAYARESMGLAMTLEEFGTKLFANGLLAGQIIEFPTWVPDEKRNLVEEKLQRMAFGMMNAGKPFFAEGGMKVSQGMLPPEDAQFLQLRGFGIDEICRIYRVPPHMVAKLDRATFSNIEQQSLDFVMYTILPYLRRIEHSVTKWLVQPGQKKRIFFRFNFEGLLRADSAARAQLYSIMLQNGVLSRNEVRALENRNQVDAEGMDDYTVQSNMALIDQIATLVAQKQTAAPPQQSGAPQ